MKVSIVIPIYGVEKFISRCAHSLFQQSYSNIEYIFVNDSTRDRSIDVLYSVIELYPYRKSQCVILNHQENRGLAEARLTGIAEITGDYVMHVDSDDYLELNAVEVLVQAALKESADIVIGGFYMVKGENARIKQIPEHLDINTYIKRILNMSIYTNVWGKLYSAKLYQPCLDTRPVTGINHGEDYVTLPRLLYYSRNITYVDFPIYNYIISNTSSFINNFSRKSMNSLIMANDILQTFFAGKLENDVLQMALLRSKLHMFKYCNIELYDEISKLYPAVTEKYYNALSISDKILLILIKYGYYKMAIMYVKIGLKLMRYVR